MAWNVTMMGWDGMLVVGIGLDGQKDSSGCRDERVIHGNLGEG